MTGSWQKSADFNADLTNTEHNHSYLLDAESILPRTIEDVPNNAESQLRRFGHARDPDD